MNAMSPFRLNFLRALYLLVVVGTAINVWPDMFHQAHWELFEGIVACMLTSFSLLCILGLRYPLQMLPLLLWEVLWKTLWLGIVALPQWRAGHIDQAIVPNIIACSFVVLYYLGIPWRHVFAHYVTKSGDRWRTVAGRPVAVEAR
ncbi:MAG TPA: hypothetical protein DCW29_24255 [Janthinobacterium sp.]|nr:hypothetical protein [Janthinobacterium sp.]